jgi:NAD(P)-dependent dehydrogenase (short-subunit alcohol dehydrogenase family)
MLGLDCNLEADLGIDSIKRTEIFGALRDRLGFQGEAFEQEEYYIKLGKLRTIREVLTWLMEDAPGNGQTHGKAETDSAAVGANGVSDNGAVAVSAPPAALPEPETQDAPAYRFLLQARPVPLADGPCRPLHDKEVLLVTEDADGRARQVATLLRGVGYDVAFVRHGRTAQITGPGRYEADLLSRDSVKQLREWVAERHGPVTALWHLLPLNPGPATDESDCIEVRSLFLLATAFSLDLLKNKGAALAVTGMGGTFGAGGMLRCFRPGLAAVPGFVKSLAREWQDAFVKVVDIDPQMGDTQLTTLLHDELRTADRTVEVGYAAAGRCALSPEAVAVERSVAALPPITEDAVILVTGGARGITAAVCAEMARRYRPRLVLVGRSPVPDAEGPETVGLMAVGDLKRALAERRKRVAEVVTPGAVEGEYRALLRARELRSNLERLSSLGARFEYHPLDVRDDSAFADLIASVYEQHGRIDGVVHAAGALGDSLLVGKSLESFDRIFDTKVRSALTLARSLRPESLRFLAFFSTVAARFGNAGQTDYAAANEVLNKLAWKLDREWDARVFAVGWGPWDEVGMANPQLMSREYLASIGFAHMPVRVGCSHFLDELAFGRKGEAEVLVFAPTGAGPSESAYAEAQFYLRGGKVLV